MADSNIKIKTEIDIKRASIQLTTLENQMAKTADKAQKLRASMDKMKNANIPTAEYAEISNQLDKANRKFADLLYRQEQMVAEGKVGTATFNRLDAQIEEVGNEIRYAEGELADLVERGKAFTLGQDTSEYANMASELKGLEAQMDLQNQKHDLLMQKQDATTQKYTQLGEEGKKSFEKIEKSAKRGMSTMEKFGSRVKQLLVSMLIFSTIRKGINSFFNAFKEGFKNMYEDSSSFKAQVDSLQASLTTLKNAIAGAFAPIVTTVIPYIQRLIQWLTQAIDVIGQFIGALMGKKSYTRAITQTAGATDEASKSAKENADATEDEADAYADAKKEAEGYLSPIDEINKFTENNDDSSKSKTPKAKADKATPGGAGGGLMFEEVPIDNRILDLVDRLKDKIQAIKDTLQKMWDIFKGGFFDGLGDWEYRWNDIKNDLASIWQTLKDIWTDPAVMDGASKWAESFLRMLGTLAGSVASMGLTIANNLVGGLEKYLTQNKDRIKGYLISMFDVWAEINDQLSEFFSSFAYIFEAFASDQGQQVTANIIGIFADAFMGVTEIASKFGRDVITLITQPFIDNKEKFRTAIEGFLSILAILTGTIKSAIDETLDKVNDVYDNHIKPFFDDLTAGISNIVGALLDFWNETLQPFLEGVANDIDNLWKNYVQPIVNNVLELIGSLIDMIDAIWNNWIAPFIQWFIENVAPAIVPELQKIWDTVKAVFEYVATLLNDCVSWVKAWIDLITALINGDYEQAWEACKDIVDSALQFISDLLTGAFDLMKQALATWLDERKQKIEGFFKDIFSSKKKSSNDIQKENSSSLATLKSDISSKLADIKGIWDTKWDAFKDKISTTWDGIKKVVQDAIDWIEQLIEKVMEKINSLKEGVRTIKSSFSSGGSYSYGGSYSGGSLTGAVGKITSVVNSLSTIRIPKFATGGVIPTGIGQHLAVVGDNKYETEVVSPLSTMKQAMLEALEGANFGGGETTVKLYLDGRQIAESVVKAGRAKQMSTGQNMFAF